ncbi:hypothetical protein F5144DRAFT_621296 [Chaetomium tenue]|uniref:Uncharacterized protein n=1 Tax=Chaetomium tenue TaxID=1854479 RepID=A0ACB7PBN6_9PEZI|nr:hypothetical protein F5144DRAFT_621296 [Chaetomium globosum]
MEEEQPSEYPSPITNFLSAVDAEPGLSPTPDPGFSPNPNPGFSLNTDPGLSPNPDLGFSPNPNPGFNLNPNLNLRPTGTPQHQHQPQHQHPSPPKEILDHFGDTVLRVGEQPRDFKVCSHTLRRAGFAWDRVLVEQRLRARAPWWAPRGYGAAAAAGQDRDGGDGGGGGGGGAGEERDEEGCRVYGMLKTLVRWLRGDQGLGLGLVWKEVKPGQLPLVDVLRLLHVAWELGWERELTELVMAFVMHWPLRGHNGIGIETVEEMREKVSARGVRLGPDRFFRNIVDIRGQLIDNGLDFWTNLLQQIDNADKRDIPTTRCRAPYVPWNDAGREKRDCDLRARSAILLHLGNPMEPDSRNAIRHWYLSNPLSMFTDDSRKIGNELSSPPRHSTCWPRLINLHKPYSKSPLITHEESEWRYLLTVEDKQHLFTRSRGEWCEAPQSRKRR